MGIQSNYRPRKKKKLVNESEFNDGDLISKLPDPLLHHIFSFLDMKFVIQTCVLSTRWRDLWISQPIMNFDQKVYNPCTESSNFDICDIEANTLSSILFKCFIDFVEKALCLHSTSKIHTFRLSGSRYGHGCVSAGSIVPLDVWMPVLDRREVEVIDLQIDRSGGILELPACLFRCKSLTTLKLDFGPGCSSSSSRGKKVRILVPNDCRVRSPLPSLKTLHLSFCLDKGFQKFLSKCPVLETLVISNCSVEKKLDQLKLQHCKLKNFVIDTTHCCRILVLAPSLKSFTCRGDWINDYWFEYIGSLVKADIDTNLASEYYSTNATPTVSRTSNGQHVTKCLRGLSKVRSLVLSAWLLEIAIEFPADDEGTSPLKPFCNLKLLTLKTSLSKCQIRATIHLLDKCPNLETLVVKMTKPPLRECVVDEAQSNAGEEMGCSEAELAPLCEMHHHLKVVEIWDVEAAQNEFEFVKFLLKNVVVLKKVILYTSKTQSPSNNMKLKRFVQKLTALPAVSSKIGIFLL